MGNSGGLKHKFMKNGNNCELALNNDQIIITEEDKLQGKVNIELKDVLSLDINQETDNFTISLDFINKLEDNRWQHKQMIFTSQLEEQDSVKFTKQLQDEFAIVKSQRDKKLLVFINPNAGDGKGKAKYDSVSAPLFDLAGIETDVRVTDHGKHAEEILDDYDLTTVDGILAAGGDGTFNIVFMAYYRRYCKDLGVNIDDPDTKLPTPLLPMGSIPTGSSNLLVQSTTNGVTDMETATLRIISGDRCNRRGLAHYHNDSMRGFTFIGTGFITSADFIKYAEEKRSWGKMKYLYALVKGLWYFRGANVVVQYRDENDEWVSQSSFLKYLVVLNMRSTFDKPQKMHWLDVDIPILCGSENLSRWEVLTQQGALHGDEKKVQEAPNVYYFDGRKEVKIIMDKDSFHEERFTLDGEGVQCQTQEILVRPAPDVLKIYGTGEMHHNMVF